MRAVTRVTSSFRIGQEENPFAKVMDNLLGEIPILGLLSGYLFHPRYLVTSADGAELIRATKRPALLESLFHIERLPNRLSGEDERLLLIGTVVMVLLERRSG